MKTAPADVNWPKALARARGHSPFLCQSLDRLPELEALLAAGEFDAAMAMAKTSGVDGSDVGASLRRERLALSVALAIGDLAGAIPVGRVMAELSDLADRSLDRAITAAIHKRVPDAEPAGFIGIALGKHGARELNYSSDIDPILLYDPDTLPRRERDEPGEAAQRYARDIVQLLSANTAEGYVFRVDLRLRPASEVSPLAISLGAALTHYESSALTWERAAFIRARAASGDIAAGGAFLASIRPFVWRRSLDFGAIEEISRLTARIRSAYTGPLQPGPGYNVKQGRGGIREVEFYAQTHQLIHGGRDQSLRLRGTRPALDALAAADIIAAKDAAAMGEAYDRLRTIEHRLQMVNDRQTHSLPDGAALENVAQLGGYTDAAALIDDLNGLTETVAARFDRLIDAGQSDETEPTSVGIATSQSLGDLGFSDPDALEERVQTWTSGQMRALRSPAALSAFEAILPALLEALADAPDPDKAILRWEGLLARASSAINLFRLLEARPGLLDQLARILTLAGPLADELALRPDLLDILIDQTALDLPGDVAELIDEMTPKDAAGDYEKQLDRIRIVTGEKRFALGVQLIEGAHDPLDIAAALSRVAEAALTVASQAAAAEFAGAHGQMADGALVIIGLGRLGGGALTHSSDLDIIYLFSGEHEGESDGRRPLGATHYFNRLAQRVSGALSVPTAHGALYEVDTRLRPQGAQGPLAVTIGSFERYQADSAWTWEHMALTRARVLVGPPEARERLDGIIAAVLGAERDPKKLREEVLKMRGEMAAHKPARGLLDAKLSRGGLVDLEFLVHYLQLRHNTAFTPDLRGAIAQLAKAGLAPDNLLEAHDILTRLLVAARLLAPDLDPDLGKPAASAASALANACQCDSFDHLLVLLEKAKDEIAEAWTDAFGQKLETRE